MTRGERPARPAPARLGPPGPDDVGVEFNGWFRLRLGLVGALLPTALGVSGVVAAITGATTSGGATRVVVGVLGLAFLAVGGGLYFWLFRYPPEAWLDVGPDGITRAHSRGRARALTWRLAWNEIEQMSIVRPRERQTYRRRKDRWVRARPVHHVLAVVVTATAARRPDLAGLLGESRTRTVLVDLGPGRGPALALVGALHGRLSPPGITPVDRMPGGSG